MKRLSVTCLLLSALFLSGCATQSPVQVAKPVAGVTSGAVAGTLTINGEVTELRYVYARKHAMRPLDATRMGKHDGEALAAGAVTIVISNRALSADLITRIVDDRYEGAKGLSGVLVTAADSADGEWHSQFITDSFLISVAGFTSSGGDPPRVTGDRVKAKLALRNQDAVATRGFLVSLDAPLESATAWSSDYSALANPCGSPKAYEDFQTLPGKWAIERWSDEAGDRAYSGALTVDERLSADEFRGTLDIAPGDDKPDITEAVTLTCSDSHIVFHGAVVPMTRWAADTLTLDLKDKRLIGSGGDEAGHGERVVLHKAG